jgi:hypothetical protein
MRVKYSGTKYIASYYNMSGLENFRGIDASVNIMGISTLTGDFEDAKSGVDLLEVEESIIKNIKAKHAHAPSAPEKFRKELDKVIHNVGMLGLGGDDKPVFHDRLYGASSEYSRSRRDSLSSLSSVRSSHSASTRHYSQVSPRHNQQDWAPPPPPPKHKSYRRPDNNDFEFTRSEWYDKKTREEKAQDIINDILSSGNNDRRTNIDKQEEDLEDLIAREQEKDCKAILIAQYDLLVSTLKEEKIDISRIPAVTEDSPLSTINAAIRMLKHKNDLKRYAKIGEDFILFGVYGAEAIFNGETSYFGYYPTLTGWADSVKPRFRRMRADTASVVAGVMDNLKFGSLGRVLMELIPSAFLYSRTKSQNKGKQGEITEEEWKESINHLDDVPTSK